ncbi:MAG: nitroreductase family protein, partial [Candidatus Paraprevotella stercoravium]|nr:nitroreductase family protein [Candidatus Paraprevotella stercoravium]
MSHFYDLAARRRSIRRFTEQELTQDEVAALIGTALMAPSSKGTCCWQFVVIDDR